ncbi:MAG: efflux RND transporter periplasmic adaptor subunit [Pseudomonadota bacterium]
MWRSFLTVFSALVASAAASTPASAGAAEAEALSCVLLPDQKVDISSPVPGVVQEVLVERAQHVSGGDVVARMESTVEAATVTLADARASTDAEVQLRRVEQEYDAQHRDRLRKLQALNATSSQSLDDASRVAEAARLRVKLAQDRHREAVLERERAAAMLALKTIRSPIDGVIVQRHKTVGEYVEAQPIVSVARLDPLRVEVITPLSMFGTVRAGMQMAIRAETDPDTERLATVTAVDAVADPGSGTFGVQLELPNPSLALPAGIKCSGRFLSADEAAALAPAPTAVSVASAALPTGSAPGQCLRFDAVPTRPAAMSLADAARRLGADPELKAVSDQRPVGYLVATPAFDDAVARRDVVARLRTAGVSDVMVFGRGAFAGRVSVGAYNGPESAARRRDELARLGFDVEVQPRLRSVEAWQVALRLPHSLDAAQAGAALADAAAGAAFEAVPCEPSQTAARHR